MAGRSRDRVSAGAWVVNEQAPGEIVLYSREDGAPAIEVHLGVDAVWRTQQQLAELFQTSRTNVVEHIQHIYEEGELEQDATCRDFRQVRQEGEHEKYRAVADSPPSDVERAYLDAVKRAQRYRPLAHDDSPSSSRC